MERLEHFPSREGIVFPHERLGRGRLDRKTDYQIQLGRTKSLFPFSLLASLGSKEISLYERERKIHEERT